MRQRKPYHHGKLRQALLNAAISLIAEVGPTAFTLREVSRRAGVSHNAPYRHFQDRDELLEAVGEQGFLELNEAMLEASGEQRIAIDRLKHAGLAYIAFALRRPEHFTAMFDAPMPKGKHKDPTPSEKRAFQTLMNLVTECQESGQMPSGNARDFALLAWTMVHGIAKLATTGRLPYRGKSDILKFGEFVIAQSLPTSA